MIPDFDLTPSDSEVISVNEITLKGYHLSVTARDRGDDPVVMQQLIARMIDTWLALATQFIEKGIYILPPVRQGTVESRYADAINDAPKDTDAPPAPPFVWAPSLGTARVTIWDTYKGKRIGLRLDSNNDLQTVLNLWLSMHNALKHAKEVYGGKDEDDTQSNHTAPPAAAPQDKPATPKSQNAAKDGVIPLLTKKEAIATLPAGAPFRMKICQLEKHSKDGKDYYDFFEPWGGKAGQYSAKTVYADNEIALNSGLIAYLDTLGVKLGQALAGDWIVNATVGKPKTKTIKGEEKTYTDIYINSFEGQTEKV